MFLVFTLSGSMISVFLPAYYEIIGSGSLGWALQFLSIQFVVLAVAPSILLRVLRARFEALLIASFPCYMLYYGLLIARTNPLLTGFVGGAALSLFWPSFQTTAIRIAHRGRVASTFTVLWLFMSSVASVVGPIAGGLVISFGGGFPAALGISGGLYLVAFLPMWKFRFEAAASVERPRELSGPPRLDYLLAAVLAWGLTDTSWLAYPLFALSIAGSYVNLGIVVSIIGVMTSVIGIWIGRVSDRLRNRFRVVTAGTVAMSLALFGLGFVRTIPELLLVSAVTGVASSAIGPVQIGWFAENYTAESAAPFWTRFELFLNPGRLANLGLAALFVTSGNYLGYFVASGALGLLAIPLLYEFRSKSAPEGVMEGPRLVRS